MSTDLQTAAQYIINRDGWENLFTMLGISGKDSRVAGSYVARARLTDTEALDLYRENWAAQRYAEAIVADAIRAWYELEVEDDEDDDAKTEVVKLVEGEWTRLGVQAKFEEANIWARVLGGAAILIGADDGQELDQPLALDRIKSVKYLHLVDRRYVRPDGEWDSTPDSPNYGLPAVYHVQPPAMQGTRWHWTRVLRFEGQRVTDDRRRELQSWGDSAYESAYGPLRNYQQIVEGAASAGQAFVQGVLKVKDFASLMASGKESDIVARVTAFKLGLSMSSLALIDADYETYDRMGMPITGLPELLDRLGLDLAGALEMPQSKLYGNQAGKLAGATEDTKTWDNQVDRMRTRNLTPQITYLTRLLMLAKDGPLKGREPQAWKLEPEPLTQPDKDKEVERKLKKAQTHKLYYDMNAVESSEVRASGDIDCPLNPEITTALEEADLAARQSPAPTEQAGQAGPANPAGAPQPAPAGGPGPVQPA